MSENKDVVVQGEVVGKEVDISKARELVAVQTQELSLKKETHKQLLEQAEVFLTSGALPKSIVNAPQVYMMLKAGQERGLSEVESLNSFYFVNGKLSMYGPAIIAQVIRAGHVVQWGECSDKSATVKIIRGDNKEVSLEDTLTIEQAQKAGGTSQVWKQHARNMLKYRIFRMVANFVCPDALQGISIESDTPFVVDSAGRTFDAEISEDVKMTNSDISKFWKRMTETEGYSKEEVNKAIVDALDRDKFGDLMQCEAESVEAKLKENRDNQAAGQETTADVKQKEMSYDNE